MYSKSFGVTVSSRVLQVFQNLTGISLPPLVLEFVPLVQFAGMSHLAQGWVLGALALQLDTDPSWPGARLILEVEHDCIC